MASRGSGLDQNRLWLGLVDLRRISSGTVFREVHPASEMGCKHRQNRLFPGVGDLAPKARKTFFYEISDSESALFVYRRPPGHLCGPYFKVTAQKNNGNPAVLFSQCYKPHLENWQKMCLNSTFFRYSARSPHRATKPSRGWLRVGISKPHFILVATVAARN